VFEKPELKRPWAEVVAEADVQDQHSLESWFVGMFGKPPGGGLWLLIYADFLRLQGFELRDPDGRVTRQALKSEFLLPFLRSVAYPPPNDPLALLVWRVIRNEFTLVPKDGVIRADGDVVGLISQTIREFRIQREGRAYVPDIAKAEGGDDGSVQGLESEGDEQASGTRAAGESSGDGPGGV